MISFNYVAQVPSLNTTTNLKELTFASYKQLVKLVLNDNNEQIIDTFNQIIDQLSTIESKNLTYLDKLIILLTIRSVCVYPALELSLEAKNKQIYNLKFEISDIIDKLNNSLLFKKYNNVVKTYDKFKITYGIPEQLYFNNENDLVISCIKTIQTETNGDITKYKDSIIDSLPAVVYFDAKQHIKEFESEIGELTLLTVQTSVGDSESSYEITPSVFNNSPLELLKLSFKRDLISLYELEYFLSAKLNLSSQLIQNSTYAELMIYIGFYNDERKQTEVAEKQAFKNPLSPNG